MANKHPYIASSGAIVQAVEQFRKSFPQTVDASTFQKLGIAPKNESYLINIFKFLLFIGDENNKKEKLAEDIFSKHVQKDFEEVFAEAVHNAYSAVFDLRGDEAWQLSNDQLISFFRGHDKTTQIVGTRQAKTFATLAGLAGKREKSLPKSASAKSKSVSGKAGGSKIKDTQSGGKASEKSSESHRQGDVALTVRIEVNLPSDASQETYDHIFKSIRKNLLNGGST